MHSLIRLGTTSTKAKRSNNVVATSQGGQNEPVHEQCMKQLPDALHPSKMAPGASPDITTIVKKSSKQDCFALLYCDPVATPSRGPSLQGQLVPLMAAQVQPPEVPEQHPTRRITTKGCQVTQSECQRRLFQTARHAASQLACLVSTARLIA